MRSRLFIFAVLGLAVTTWAQQGNDSGGAKPSQPPANSAGQPAEKRPATPDELKFPEPDPQPEAPAPSSTSTSPSTSRASHLAPPRSDRVQADELGSGTGESSSKDTQTDLSAPEDDAKAHPKSTQAVGEAEAAALGSGGVSEFHTWDPHKAAKDVEVGDFYFKRKNYRAAEERYREALRYKDNDAVATIRLAVCLEKLGILDDARAEYESYLKILPHGPQAAEAQTGIDRLKAETAAPQAAR
jgi:tetratricopeptide (TPR) repeat protein